MHKHVRFPIINPQSWPAPLSGNRLWGNTETDYKDQILELTGFLNFSHFPEYFLFWLVKTEHFPETTDSWWFPIINQYLLHRYPWHEQDGRNWEKRENKSCCFSQKLWFWTDSSALNMYLSHHTVSHSKEAVLPEVTAPCSQKRAALDVAYTTAAHLPACAYTGNIPFSRKVTVT